MPLSHQQDARDQARLGQLYREHADFLWRILLRFGIPEAHAEDVAHEVFLVVRRRLADFDPDAEFKSWLYGIARGVAANVRRSLERTERRLCVVEPLPEPPTPEDELRRSRAAELVERFLQSLSPAQREVFVLIDIEGMTGPQAAEALGGNLNAVYSRLRLARIRFQRFVAAAAATPAQEETA